MVLYYPCGRKPRPLSRRHKPRQSGVFCSSMSALRTPIGALRRRKKALQCGLVAREAANHRSNIAMGASSRRQLSARPTRTTASCRERNLRRLLGEKTLELISTTRVSRLNEVYGMKWAGINGPRRCAGPVARAASRRACAPARQLRRRVPARIPRSGDRGQRSQKRHAHHRRAAGRWSRD